LFLQIATEFASVGSVISPSQPIQPGAEDKLAALRRLDRSRAWNSLDDQLYCTVCKNVISGRQIAVVGGTNGLRALHIKCSTPGCLSTPADWLLPVKSDTVPEIDSFFVTTVLEPLIRPQTKPKRRRQANLDDRNEARPAWVVISGDRIELLWACTNQNGGT